MAKTKKQRSKHGFFVNIICRTPAALAKLPTPFKNRFAGIFPTIKSKIAAIFSDEPSRNMPKRFIFSVKIYGVMI